MFSFNDTELKVIQFAESRKIIPNSSPMEQAVHLLEEVAHLIDAIQKNNYSEMRSSFGSILVTLIIGATLADTDLKDCLSDAYEEIKRKYGG
jgi:NTP pyrophosphatase (non-canonical NTP hydrolase)